MKKISACDQCRYYARNPHLVCFSHPAGVDGESCHDFEAALQLEHEELWEPEGASYYNGELIIQPQQKLSLEKKWELLDWHPLFTGRCPHCEMPITQVVPPRIHWDCSSCGWKDDSV
ncbi:MAG TPA: hypothetical protein V6D10_17465 [Trichocoleus sp.]|jgi:hypothetical protein